jgi:hypothetical protein
MGYQGSIYGRRRYHSFGGFLKGSGVVMLILAALVVAIWGYSSMYQGAEADMQRVVEDAGYHNVEIGDSIWFAGSDSDTFKREFHAVNRDGKPVHGAVTGGPYKGYTVRLY